MSTDYSIVTIVKHRTQQLSHLISSIECSSLLPREMVIVWMTSPSEESLRRSDFFDIVHRFATCEELPIAKARNRGFDACSTEKVIYLDVDCMCPEYLLEELAGSLTDGNVVTANTISPTVSQSGSVSTKPFTSPVISAPEKVPFAEFDATLFSITRSDFERVGGFDTEYSGFGIGDYDFAMRCSKAGLFLLNSGRYVYKQFHVHYNPPVNHLCDLVANAELFKRKWGAYPACKWFTQFADIGLINPDFKDAGMRASRLVSEEEMSRYLVKHPSVEQTDSQVKLQQSA